MSISAFGQVSEDAARIVEYRVATELFMWQLASFTVLSPAVTFIEAVFNFESSRWEA